MELRQLEYFVAVVENGSFTSAAKSLYVSQSTLSKAVKKLEDELGVPLFIHRQNMTTPTDAGALLYEKGRLLLMEALRTRELVSGEVPGKGNIRVGTSCKRGLLLQVSNLMAKFVQTYPGVFLDLNDASPEYIKDELMRHNLDAGIIVEPMNSSLPTFDTRVLSRGDYRVALPANHPLAGRASLRYADLAHERWIQYRPTFRLAQMVQAGCEAAGFTPKVVLTSSQTEFILSLVNLGYGISIQAWPKEEQAGDRTVRLWENVVFLPLEDIQSQYAVKLITVKDSYLSPATRTFLDFASAHTF